MTQDKDTKTQFFQELQEKLKRRANKTRKEYLLQEIKNQLDIFYEFDPAATTINLQYLQLIVQKITGEKRWTKRGETEELLEKLNIYRTRSYPSSTDPNGISRKRYAGVKEKDLNQIKQYILQEYPKIPNHQKIQMGLIDGDKRFGFQKNGYKVKKRTGYIADISKNMPRTKTQK